MKRARFKTVDDGTCFGEIPGLAGVWANETTARTCRDVLQEVLEEWLIVKIHRGGHFYFALIRSTGRLGRPSAA